MIELSDIINAMDEDYTFNHDTVTEALHVETKEQFGHIKNPDIEKTTVTTLDMISKSSLNVAFSSYLTSSIPILEYRGNHTILRCDGIFLNDGNGYDSETGKFTVQKQGTYLFIFYFSSFPEEASVDLMINGNNYTACVRSIK